VGPKSALKLMKEHGTLEKVVAHLRAKSELKAAKSQKKKVVDEDDVESEDEVPPTSDIEREGGSDRENAEEDDAAMERRKQNEQKKKAASKRGTGGAHVPETWMWEEAKKLFEKPDVTPANEIEVRAILSILAEITDQGCFILSQFVLRRLVIFYRCQLIWETPDVEGLVEFLVREKGFK